MEVGRSAGRGFGGARGVVKEGWAGVGVLEMGAGAVLEMPRVRDGVKEDLKEVREARRQRVQIILRCCGRCCGLGDCVVELE